MDNITRNQAYDLVPLTQRRDYSKRPEPILCLCPKCKENKILKWYWHKSDNRFGLESYCSDCARRKERKIICTLDLKRIGSVEIKYTVARNWQYSNKNNYSLGNGKFGIEGSLSACKHFESLWNHQEGLCAISQIPLKFGGKTFYSAVVDHDHSTGRIRGLVLSGLNILEGHLNRASLELKIPTQKLVKDILDYVNSTEL